MVKQGDIVGIHQVFNVEESLSLFHAVLGQGGGTGLFVDDIIALDHVHFLFGVHLFNLVHLEGFGKSVRLRIQIGGFVALAGDDQRGTRLVDEDGVHFVNDGKMMTTLYFILFINDHVVA